MKMRMAIGGVEFTLNPAAIACIRYRAEYGDSLVNDMARCETVEEMEGLLLRMCRCMMGADRPELSRLASLARKDTGFFRRALDARAALLREDPRWNGGRGEAGEAFDEYRILAAMGAAGMGLGLIYELPIMHIVAILGRCGGDGGESYRKLDAEEMKMLYPR